MDRWFSRENSFNSLMWFNGLREALTIVFEAIKCLQSQNRLFPELLFSEYTISQLIICLWPEATNLPPLYFSLSVFLTHYLGF